MEISESMLRYYLDSVTVAWFNQQDLPPEDVRDYRPFVMDMKTKAIQHGDMDALKLAFEYLLGNPHINCEPYGDERYPYDNKEVREIIQYALRTIWPNADPIPSAGPPDVKLVTMSLEDWWSSR